MIFEEYCANLFYPFPTEHIFKFGNIQEIRHPSRPEHNTCNIYIYIYIRRQNLIKPAPAASARFEFLQIRYIHSFRVSDIRTCMQDGNCTTNRQENMKRKKGNRNTFDRWGLAVQPLSNFFNFFRFSINDLLDITYMRYVT